MGETPYLDYESLDVYRCAIEFVALATRIGAALPRGESELKDQLKRASMSVPLNIAESSGRSAGADRARFLTIARASALEWAVSTFSPRVPRCAPTEDSAPEPAASRPSRA